jgi:hypothetical protein
MLCIITIWFGLIPGAGGGLVNVIVVDPLTV